MGGNRLSSCSIQIDLVLRTPVFFCSGDFAIASIIVLQSTIECIRTYYIDMGTYAESSKFICGFFFLSNRLCLHFLDKEETGATAN